MLALVGQQLAGGRRPEDVADLEQPDAGLAAGGVVGHGGRRSPGSSEVRSTDSSATSGLASSMPVGVEPGSARWPGARNGSGMASARPSPVSSRRTARRSRWRSVRRPTRGCGEVAAAGCCCSRGGGRPPRRRRSRSRSRSATAGRPTSWSSPDRRARRSRSGSSSARMRPAARSVPRRALTRAVRTRTGERSGSSPRPSTWPGAVVAPQISAASWQKRSAASSMTSGSEPFSKRAEPPSAGRAAGERAADRRSGRTTPSRAARRWWSSEISQSAPPMTPAMPTGAVVAVADQQVVGGERALDVVERVERLAVGGPADPQRRRPPPWPGRRGGSAGRARASRSSRCRRAR